MMNDVNETWIASFDLSSKRNETWTRQSRRALNACYRFRIWKKTTSQHYPLKRLRIWVTRYRAHDSQSHHDRRVSLHQVQQLQQDDTVWKMIALHTYIHRRSVSSVAESRDLGSGKQYRRG